MTNYGENRESPEAIKADIERTRSQMSNKIDTLQERLSPDTLKAQAQEAVRGAVQEGANAMKEYVQEHSIELRDAVIHAFKRNPLPTALIGIGVGWMLFEGVGGQKSSSSTQYDWSSGRDAYARQRAQNEPSDYEDRYRSRVGPYAGSNDWADSADSRWGAEEGSNGHNRPIREQVQDAAGQVVDQISNTTQRAREQISQLGSQVTDKAQDLSQQTRQQINELTAQTQHQASHLLEENPLALGAAALALGAVVGLLLPITRRENEMVGPYRDQVIEKAQAVAGTVAQRVQEVVQEVKPEVEQLASQTIEGLKPKVEQLGQKVVGDLKQTGQEAISGATGSSSGATGSSSGATGSYSSATGSSSGATDSTVKIKNSPEEDKPTTSAGENSNTGQGWSASESTQGSLSSR